MKEGTVLNPGSYYRLANNEIGIVGFKLLIGGGFLGMTMDGSKMPRWWNDQGIDNRDKEFNIVEEVPNPYDSRKNNIRRR